MKFLWLIISSFACVPAINIKHIIHDLTWNFSNETIYWPKQRPFEFTKQDHVAGVGFAMLKLLSLIFNLSLINYVTCQEDAVDLSWDFGNQTVYVSGLRKFAFSKKYGGFSEKGQWYSVNEFCAAEHGGTHFDAPYHFYEKGLKVSEIDVEKLFPKGALLDLSQEAEHLGRNLRLTVKHLENWESQNGPFESGSVLLIKFGRSRFWPNRTLYLDLEGDTMNFPGISNEAAQWIVDSNKFYGIGVDTPSLDPGNTTDFFVHTLLAKHSLYNLENVKLLDKLPTRFQLVVAPMKIEDGTGAPVRIFAKITRALITV